MTKTFLQIQKQIEKLQKEADALRKKEANGVLERIKQAITVYGFTAEDLGLVQSARSKQQAKKPAKKAPPKSKVAAAKYKDEQGNAWGGRGPRPAWFKAALASGKSPQDLLA